MFGGHAMRPAVEGGRIKVTDNIVWINVRPPDGIPRRYAGKSGESLLQVLDRARTPGIHCKLTILLPNSVSILADCDGGDSEHTFEPFQVPFDFYSAGVHCGQCSVHIPDPFFDKLNARNSSEIHRLETRDSPNSTVSRLACCVQIRPELNEMIVLVGDNKTTAGDWFTGDDANSF